MKRWALLTAGCYAVVLMLIAPVTAPLLFPIEILRWIRESAPGQNDNLRAFLTLLIASLVLALLQFLFLLVPIRVSARRPVHRRHIGFLIVSSGVLFALLVGSLCLSITETAARTLPGEWLFLAMGAGWLVWGGYFFALYLRGTGALRLGCMASRWLLQGSVLGILVAIPSHVIARYRNYCCAGFGTFLGLATGLAVMFFAYGPGVLFLFAERIGRLRRVWPQPTRIGPEGRALAGWVAVSGSIPVCGLLLAGAATVAGVDVLNSGQFRIGLIVYIAAAGVCALAAVLHGLLSWRNGEPGKRTTVVLVVLALEILFAIGLLLPSNWGHLVSAYRY